MPGDFRDVIQRTYGVNVLDIDLPNELNPLVAVKAPTKFIVIQYITFVPSTYAQATLTFVDSVTGLTVGTIVVPAQAPATGDGSNTFVLTWGPSGTKLAQGASLNYFVTPAGASGRLHVETYQKPNVYSTTGKF